MEPRHEVVTTHASEGFALRLLAHGGLVSATQRVRQGLSHYTLGAVAPSNIRQYDQRHIVGYLRFVNGAGDFNPPMFDDLLR